MSKHPSITAPRRAARRLEFEILEDRRLPSAMPLIDVAPLAATVPAATQLIQTAAAPPITIQTLPSIIGPVGTVVQSTATTIDSAVATVAPLVRSVAAPVEHILAPAIELAGPVSQALTTVVGETLTPVTGLLRPAESAAAHLSEPVIGSLAPAVSQVGQLLDPFLRHAPEALPIIPDSVSQSVHQGPQVWLEAPNAFSAAPVSRDEATVLLSYLITGIVPGNAEGPVAQGGAAAAPATAAAPVSYEGSGSVLPVASPALALVPQASGALADGSPFDGVALETAWTNFLDQIAVTRYELLNTWAGLGLALWLIGAGFALGARQQRRFAKAGLRAAINEDDATLAWSLGLGQACAAE